MHLDDIAYHLFFHESGLKLPNETKDFIAYGLAFERGLEQSSFLKVFSSNPSDGALDSGRILKNVSANRMYLSLLTVKRCHGHQPTGSGLEKTM